MSRARGFTLLELVLVIVITGIMAASVAVFFKPAVDAYFDARRRAELTDTADTALRRIGREVRRAVPNSIRIPNPNCFELVPTKSGGLYRRAVDIDHVPDSDPLDTTVADASFDVLALLPVDVVPVAGDSVVIGNQNTNDVYQGTTRGTVSAWESPLAPIDLGVGRITLTAPTQFPAGYDGGRFQIVDAREPSVFYVCSGAGEANGNGTGQLFRVVQGFTAGYPAACPAGGVLLANNVAACEFVYNPNQGATQQSGFVWMRIELLRGGERMALAYGAHVSNVP